MPLRHPSQGAALWGAHTQVLAPLSLPFLCKRAEQSKQRVCRQGVGRHRGQGCPCPPHERVPQCLCGDRRAVLFA